jgi:hypothetical protein
MYFAKEIKPDDLPTSKSSITFQPKCKGNYMPLFDRNSKHFYDRDLKSVSMLDIHKLAIEDKQKAEHDETIRSLATPNMRTKHFNSSFKIWKRGDLILYVQNTKVGQTFEAEVPHISDSNCFYVHNITHKKKLLHMESCIEAYCDEWLNDEKTHEELFFYQQNVAKYDVVLVKNEREKWKRAIYLDRVSAESFEHYSDDDDTIKYQNMTQNKDKSNPSVYLSFHLIDWGEEITLTKSKRDLSNEIFILPLDEKLIRVGVMSLKCKIDQSFIKKRETLCKNSEIERLNEQRKNTFEIMFKKLLQNNQQIKVRVMQTSKIGYSLEIMANLYFMPDDAEKLIEKFEHENHLVLKSIHEQGLFMNELDESFFNLINFNKKELNCKQFILGNIKMDELKQQIEERDEFTKEKALKVFELNESF